jgi:hypothetical protein
MKIRKFAAYASARVTLGCSGAGKCRRGASFEGVVDGRECRLACLMGCRAHVAIWRGRGSGRDGTGRVGSGSGRRERGGTGRESLQGGRIWHCAAARRMRVEFETGGFRAMREGERGHGKAFARDFQGVGETQIHSGRRRALDHRSCIYPSPSRKRLARMPIRAMTHWRPTGVDGRTSFPAVPWSMDDGAYSVRAGRARMRDRRRSDLAPPRAPRSTPCAQRAAAPGQDLLPPISGGGRRALFA